MDKRITEFLIRAKKATYAGKGAETASSRPESTVAEGLRLVSLCLRSMLGPCKIGACDAFRIEADAAPGGAPAPSMWLYSDAGFGVVKASRVVGGGVVGDPLLMDRAAVKKQARGVLVTLLGDDRAEGLQVPAED